MWRMGGKTGAVVVGALAATAGFGGGAASAATPNQFNCSAEALTASIARQAPIEPLGAGSRTGACGDDSGGGQGTGQSTSPSLLGLDGAYATTSVSPSPTIAPALQTARATAGVADARLDPAGNTVRVQGVQAESSVTCVNGTSRFAGTGRVAKLFVFGQEVPLNDGATQLVTALDGLTQVLVHVRLNREIRTASGYEFRALQVTAPMDGALLDVSAGVTRLSTTGSPCADFTGTGPNPNPGVPTPGFPFGGGNVVNIRDLPAALRRSPCATSRRFGRFVAIVGDNRRNNLTGSKFADRIFGLGARDRLNGGAGVDCIEAGTGSDIVNGGTQSDVIYGRGSRDYLDGGAGRDRILGGSGNDLIATGTGRDRANGGPGNDRILTRDGLDVLQGGPGRDRISAANGGRRDRISCGSGRDIARVDKIDRVSRNCERVVVVRGKRGKKR